METKCITQRKHALRRIRERYGISLSQEEYWNIVRQIQTGKAKFVERQSCRVTLFRVTVRDIAIVVSYDKNTHQVSTFLSEVIGKEHLALVV
jgi:hypothetical protein